MGRESLITATRTLLRTRRPDELTAQRIAAEAQTDPRMITYYFGSKAKLMSTVAVQAFDEFRAAVAQSSGPPSVADELRDRIRTYRGFSREHPHLSQLLSDHLGDPGPAAVDAGLSAAEVSDRFLQIALLALSSFPFTSPGLFASVAGEGVSEALLDQYDEFVVELALAGEAQRPS